MMTKKYTMINSTKVKFIFIILGAVVFSTAPFWHVAFKDNTVKILIKEYLFLKDDGISAKSTLISLISKYEDNPTSSTLQSQIFKAQNEYRDKYALANAAFENLNKIKKENDFLFFKDKEQFVNYLGIAVFLFYAAFSMFSFYYNRRSENKDYLQAVKIKSILLLGGATFYAAYILYPSGGDFDGGVYWYISCMAAFIAIAFSFTFIKYVVDLEGQVLSLKGNLGKAFQYITTLKQKLLPIANQAIDTAGSEQDKASIVNTLYDLEDKEQVFSTNISEECRKIWKESGGTISFSDYLDMRERKQDELIQALCKAILKGETIKINEQPNKPNEKLK